MSNDALKLISMDINIIIFLTQLTSYVTDLANHTSCKGMLIYLTSFVFLRSNTTKDQNSTSEYSRLAYLTNL